MKEQEFKPYVPADKVTSELTVTSVVVGILLAIVFGAANAYLGLRVGMTVSASIPAAVISMAIIRIILRRDSILENNMVQTIGSAGEAVAAGAIFTMPVLFLWAKEGVISSPSLITLSAIALCGGVLGVFFMIPLRDALIVKEHGKLPYPEGTACADVLMAGETGGKSAAAVFSGLGVAAVLKILVDGIKVAAGVVTIPIKSLKTEISTETYPALIGVGYICGPKIAGYMLAGGVLGWLVLIPAIVAFGGDTVMNPAADTVANLYAAGGAGAIWSNYIKYIGAGAVACGGVISLIKSLPTIVSTFGASMKDLKNAKTAQKSTLRTNSNLSMRTVILGIVIVALIIWALPIIPVGPIGTILIVLFGFFFATVSSRMVGLVGSSNNPVSGMTIATLIFTTLVLKLTGNTGAAGMASAICIGSVICLSTCVAGDTSQDLKTGYLLGATPRNQQIGELIGALTASISIGGVLILLDKAWGFGTTKLAAPQATLMKVITEGVMNGNLPWTLVFIGIFIAIAIEIIGVSALPVAIGLYLPFELSAAIMLGGLARLLVDKKSKAADKDSEVNAGVLFSSGLIAGEGLVGIVLAVLAVIGVEEKIDLSGVFNLGVIGGVLVLVVCLLAILKYGFKTNEK